jgi:hypothetical protein
MNLTLKGQDLEEPYLVLPGVLLMITNAMRTIKCVLAAVILWLAFPMMCAGASFIVYGSGWLVYRLVTA